MISEETWEKFRNGKVVFGCTTQELWDGLMVELEKHGYRIKLVQDSYRDNNDGYGVRNERTSLMCGYIGNYRLSCRELEIINITSNDVSVPIHYPQPPQELVNILRAIANHKTIEKTYGVQLELDSLYSKRDEYLAKWTSEFEVHL